MKFRVVKISKIECRMGLLWFVRVRYLKYLLKNIVCCFFSNKNEHNKLICCRLSPSSWPIWSKWDYLSDEAYLAEVSHWVHVLGNVYPPTLISWLLQNEHFYSSMALCHHGALPLHCMGKCSELIKDWISQTEGDLIFPLSACPSESDVWLT